MINNNTLGPDSIRQGLLFQRFKCKLARSVNDKNEVRQTSITNSSEREDHNFFLIVNLNPNSVKNSLHMNFFLNLFLPFILNITFISHFLFKISLCSNWINNIYFFLFIVCFFLKKKKKKFLDYLTFPLHTFSTFP